MQSWGGEIGQSNRYESHVPWISDLNRKTHTTNHKHMWWILPDTCLRPKFNWETIQNIPRYQDYFSCTAAFHTVHQYTVWISMDQFGTFFVFRASNRLTHDMEALARLTISQFEGAACSKSFRWPRVMRWASWRNLYAHNVLPPFSTASWTWNQTAPKCKCLCQVKRTWLCFFEF